MSPPLSPRLPLLSTSRKQQQQQQQQRFSLKPSFAAVAIGSDTLAATTNPARACFVQ